MYPPPARWARAPDLIVNQDFDHGTDLISIDDSDATSLFLDNTSNYGPDISWCVQSNAGEGTGTGITRVNEPYHVGVYNISTHTTDNGIVAVGLDLGVIGTTGNGSLIAPVCPVLGVNVYRWEWLINITSIASVNYRIGVIDSSPLGTRNHGAYLDFDTDTDANWHAVNVSGGTATDESTGVAATTGWHRFAAELKPDESNVMAYHYYQDHVLLRTVDANIPTGPVTLIASVRTRTTASKSMSFDRARLWTDGHNQIDGGTP